MTSPPDRESDRELLEAAAKAAGIRLEWDGDPRQWQPMYYEGKTYHSWNPLADDSDALRLAVKLKIDLEFDVDEGQSVEAYRRAAFHDDEQAVFCATEYLPAFGSDPYAATRRAIVRAAAALGKEMP